jgi:hypothetical protein
MNDGRMEDLAALANQPTYHGRHWIPSYKLREIRTAIGARENQPWWKPLMELLVVFLP